MVSSLGVARTAMASKTCLFKYLGINIITGPLCMRFHGEMLMPLGPRLRTFN